MAIANNHEYNGNLAKYKVVAFDVDGTLYDQKRLRLIMAVRLGKFYLTHPLRMKELLIVKNFRTNLEHFNEIAQKSDIPEEALKDAVSYTAYSMKEDEARVRAIVDKWIYKNPLDVIKMTSDDRLCNLFSLLKKCGFKVVVFSDHPVSDKLDALSLEADAVYYTGDGRLKDVKPSPKGVELIASDWGVGYEQILIIGDRYEKDGMSAVNAGSDYLIVDRDVSKRGRVHDELLAEVRNIAE